MKNNNELRKEYLKKRNELSIEEVLSRSKIIEDKLYHAIHEYDTDNVLCFYPLKKEVNLLGLYNILLGEGYNLYFPVTFRDGLRFYKVNNMEEFSIGTFDVYEPDDRRFEFRSMEAFVITPGLVFDKDNNRVGYGMAYYDRFLRHNTQVTPVGVCFDFQVVEKVNATPLDIPVKKLITD